MTKLTAEDKIILTFLLINCEIYRLNEKDALEYIHSNLLLPVSKRTYYNYKKKVYEICLSIYESDNKEKDKNFQFLQLLNPDDVVNHEHLRVALLHMKELLTSEALELGIDLKNPILYTSKLFTDSSNRFRSVLINHIETLYKFKQKILSNRINRKSIPSNATIKKEYIKCGKEDCKSCKHGPYYYGYWRDKNGKLKKKYIGINK